VPQFILIKEDTKIYKEIIKDILCVAPEYGKKIARMAFNKDLKCGNIFMHLEEDPTENNKIVLDIEKYSESFEGKGIKLREGHCIKTSC